MITKNNFCDFVPFGRLKSIGQLSNSAIGQSEEPAQECDNPYVRPLEINLWLCAFVAFEINRALSNSAIEQSEEPAEECDNP